MCGTTCKSINHITRVGSGLEIHILLWSILTSLNFKLLVLSIGSGLEIHILCGTFSLV